MLHSVTRQTISSYKKLMNDPATAEVWQTAFGRDFGEMAQEDNKTGLEGTHAIFMMTHDKIAHALVAKNVFHLQKPCCGLQTTEGVPTSYPNNGRG
jgi:hypothetical protein